MGCDYYDYGGCRIHFSEMDDNVGCLCTFPGNDMEELSIERLRSLAMLGAAIRLVHNCELEGLVILPHALPKWIIDGINKYLPDKEM